MVFLTVTMAVTNHRKCERCILILNVENWWTVRALVPTMQGAPEMIMLAVSPRVSLMKYPHAHTHASYREIHSLVPSDNGQPVVCIL